MEFYTPDLFRGFTALPFVPRPIMRKKKKSEPYDPQNPDMPPLINDIVMSEDAWRRFNAEAAECHRIAAATGLPGLIRLVDGRIVWTPSPRE